MVVTVSISKIALCFLLGSRLPVRTLVSGWVTKRKRIDHMLTIFGKKKKDDPSVQIDTGTDASQAASQTRSTPPGSVQAQAPVPITTQNQPTTWPTQSSVMSQPIPPPPAPAMRQMTPGPSQVPTPRQLPLDASFPSEETS